MTNTDLHSSSIETSKLSDFSFGLAASPDNAPEHLDVNQEPEQKPQRKRPGKSTPGDLFAALVILAAAIMGTLGVNSEMMIHYFPQVAAVLHLSSPAERAALPSVVNAKVKVWVDLNTGLYYCPGADSYGRTRSGRYLKQADARLGNFEPAGRRECTTESSAMLEGLAHQ
ncbi:MAG TPA: hypothetical protein VJN48_00250 [Terriglobales bacterium]|nr:hypothetical protein [Terriglobales bacterium]